MKELPLILTLHASVLSAFIWLASPACADSGTDYKAGSDFAKQVQGSGIDSLKNFSGEQNLPGYTDSPDQTKYYGGVTASGDSSLKGDSASEFSQGETGKIITESFTNRPPDLISPDAPFIQSAKDIESRADTIVGDTGQACMAQVVNRSEFTNHTCERDLQVEQYCMRTATITGHYNDTTTTDVYSVALKDAWQEGDQVKVRFSFGVTGTLIHAEAQYFITSLPNYAPPGQARTLYALGGSVRVEGGQEWKTLSGGGYQVVEGRDEIMTIKLHDSYSVSYFAGVLARNLRSGYITLNIRATMQVASKEWEAEKPPIPAAPPPQMDILQKQALLQQATKKALAEAIMYPSVPAFVKYFRLQNYWTQQAGLFSMSAKKAMLAHPELDYNLQYSHYNGTVKNQLAADYAEQRRAISTLAQHFGVMFFYRGREAIDGQLVQVIQNFRETYGLSVIPVSVDGVINPMLPDSRTDQGQAAQLGVKYFPAMMLVDPKSGQVKPLSYGFISQDDLAKQFLYVSSDFKPNF